MAPFRKTAVARNVADFEGLKNVTKLVTGEICTIEWNAIAHRTPLSLLSQFSGIIMSASGTTNSTLS